MVNAGDVFVCVVAGLAMPLAMLDGYKALSKAALPEQAGGLHFERRATVWLLAILFGPALFMERMLSARRAGELSMADSINAFVIVLGWAGLYGFVVLGLFEAWITV